MQVELIFNLGHILYTFATLALKTFLKLELEDLGGVSLVLNFFSLHHLVKNMLEVLPSVLLLPSAKFRVALAHKILENLGSYSCLLEIVFLHDLFLLFFSHLVVDYFFNFLLLRVLSTFESARQLLNLALEAFGSKFFARRKMGGGIGSILLFEVRLAHKDLDHRIHVAAVSKVDHTRVGRAENRHQGFSLLDDF